MLVSVLIPTYKRLQFLKCAVEDVLVQTFKDWEIVVSDDEVGEGEVLLSLEEKPENPKSHWCTPPFYYYRREDAARLHEAIADGCGTDAPGSLVAWMCAHTVLHSWEMPGNRYDIGSLESYRKVQETYRGIVR